VSTSKGGRRWTSGLRASTPLVSIVVVIYNGADALRVLLESIVPHCGEPIEVIVIDGGSTDETVVCIKEFETNIDCWQSERDQGIYDAMNKGVAMATGRYVLHLNAGDRLLKIPYMELQKCLTDGVDVVCCDVSIGGEGIFRPRVGFMLKLDNTWHHQGTFYRRESHLGYDTNYRIYADFDLNQRLSARGATVRTLPVVVAEFSTDGASATMGSYSERYRVIRKNFGIGYLPIAFARFQLNALRRKLRQFGATGYRSAVKDRIDAKGQAK
jgi:glycosyltransferase involved in cell wall biosynthesis